MSAIAFTVSMALMTIAVWKFCTSEWSSTWRTRRSGPETNWENEGYMASQDGKSWSQIDGTIASSAPPRSQMPGPEGR